MKIEDIEKNFLDRLTDIALYQRAAKETAKKELKELNTFAMQLKEHIYPDDFGDSFDAMRFRDPITGESKRYGFRQSSLDDRVMQVILQKNKQYCWLLVEAYEEFEIFIKGIYAYIGKHNNASWLMHDFQNIQLSEISSKDFQWYVDCAKNKKDIPQSIISRLRILYPEISTFETKNKLNIDLQFAIKTIERLRHIIVHRGGKVASKDEFIKDLLNRAGKWNNGRPDQSNKDFVENFFGTGDFSNTVMLLEMKIPHKIPLDIYIDLYGELSEYLVAEAFLICQCVSKTGTK
jgi:hypothetical protein